MEIGSTLVHKESKNRYKIIDIFHYKNTVKKGYILKDTWNRYSEPLIIGDEKVRKEYDYKR